MKGFGQHRYRREQGLLQCAEDLATADVLGILRIKESYQWPDVD